VLSGYTIENFLKGYAWFKGETGQIYYEGLVHSRLYYKNIMCLTFSVGFCTLFMPIYSYGAESGADLTYL